MLSAMVHLGKKSAAQVASRIALCGLVAKKGTGQQGIVPDFRFESCLLNVC